MFRIRLKELREEKMLSQAAFAKLLGLAQSTIGNWEAGSREPNFETISRLADFFGVSVDYLLGRTDQRGPRPQWGEQERREFSGLSDMEKLRVFAEKGVPEDLRREFERVNAQLEKRQAPGLEDELIAAYAGNKDYLTEGDLRDLRKLIELRAELNGK